MQLKLKLQLLASRGPSGSVFAGEHSGSPRRRPAPTRTLAGSCLCLPRGEEEEEAAWVDEDEVEERRARLVAEISGPGFPRRMDAAARAMVSGGAPGGGGGGDGDWGADLGSLEERASLVAELTAAGARWAAQPRPHTPPAPTAGAAQGQGAEAPHDTLAALAALAAAADPSCPTSAWAPFLLLPSLPAAHTDRLYPPPPPPGAAPAGPGRARDGVLRAVMERGSAAAARAAVAALRDVLGHCCGSVPLGAPTPATGLGVPTPTTCLEVAAAAGNAAALRALTAGWAPATDTACRCPCGRPSPALASAPAALRVSARLAALGCPVAVPAHAAPQPLLSDPSSMGCLGVEVDALAVARAAADAAVDHRAGAQRRVEALLSVLAAPGQAEWAAGGEAAVLALLGFVRACVGVDVVDVPLKVLVARGTGLILAADESAAAAASTTPSTAPSTAAAPAGAAPRSLDAPLPAP